MDVIGWAQDRSKAMTLWDIGLLKVYSALFGVLAGIVVIGLLSAALDTWGLEHLKRRLLKWKYATP